MEAIGAEQVRKARRAANVAAGLCGFPARDLAAKQREQGPKLARHLAMYLANRTYRVPLACTAKLFGTETRSARAACRRIDALREDPRFDWQVFEVETLLRAIEIVEHAEVRQ